MDCEFRSRVFIYALGNSLGHGLRAYSMARQLLQGDPSPSELCIAINTPRSSFLESLISADPLTAGIQLLRLPSSWDAADCGRAIEQSVRRFRPTDLVVDTFPRGVGGELLASFFLKLACSKTLISSQLPRSYVMSMELEDFVDQHYDYLINPGDTPWYRSNYSPPSPLCSSTVFPFQTAPFQIRSQNELPSRMEAAQEFGVDVNSSKILFVESGTWDECREIHRLYHEVKVRIDQGQLQHELEVVLSTAYSTSERPPSNNRLQASDPPPFLQLPAIDLVVGAAENFLHFETSALNVPAILIARQRKHDFQYGQTSYRGSLDANEIVKRWRGVQEESARNGRAPVSYENGAEEAAAFLMQRGAFDAESKRTIPQVPLTNVMTS